IVAYHDRRTVDALLGLLTPLPYDLLQRDGVEELDRPSLHLDQAFVLEARKQPADGLELETKKTADLLARHPQHKLGGRISALLVALGERQQEYGKALVGAHAAEKQHHVLVARDFLRHQPQQIMPERWDCTRDVLDALEREHADFGILEIHRLAPVTVGNDAVEPDHV